MTGHRFGEFPCVGWSVRCGVICLLMIFTLG